MEKVYVDFVGFQNDLELHDMMLKDLYINFVEELKKQKNLLIYQFQNSNIKEVSIIIHDIKGITANYRANQAYEISKQLNEKIKENNEVLINYYTQALIEVIDETITFIYAYFSKY